MIALIFGWEEGDSNLVESVLGIYDSEESIPGKYRISNEDVDYLGFKDNSDYDAPCYIRLQEIEINKEIHLLDDVTEDFLCNWKL